jgi:class 3 adenylate cyclase/predicted ATPase/DNA polymerase III delta prime subunit
MFCDLVGSTALAARTDPEDLRDIVSAYHQCIAENVERFGGSVAEYMGDGALIYFGWPKAGEADAERAVRTGLALIVAIDRLSARGEKLRSRIGIATGLVVGSGAAQEHSAVGETPNLASRLQALAQPDSMVIDHSTRTELGGLFECQDLGAIELKGLPAPVRAWRVLREASVQSRFDALHVESLTPLVGREEEVEQLLRRWREVKAGEGKIVLISGEPGIGKSRLITALAERLRGEAHTRLRYFCSPYHTDSALHPIMAQLERAASFERDDSPGVKLDKLEALLEGWTQDVRQDASLLAEALSIPSRDPYAALNLSPQKRKEEILKALLTQLTGLAQTLPVLMTFEDVHWIDPTSLELLELTVERVQGLRVLLLITFRPEFIPRWIGQAHVTLLTLNRLDQRQAAALIESITGGQALPTDLRDQIIDHTDGVPLFIEELTKSVVENVTRPADAGGPLAIPGTLHASLMARLDRLPAAKQVAQIGAVIGRDFRQDLLMAVAPMPAPDLLEGLDQLVAAGLLFRRGAGPDAFYQFKHALVGDAAYESLLRRERSAVHARIVRALQRLSPEMATAQPELLGHHCERAGLIEQAADYYRSAGERSIAQSAMAEARAHLKRGLGLVERLADGTDRRRLEGGLQLAFANVGIISEGYGGPEIAARLARAVELSRGVGRGELLIRALFGEWTYKLHVGDLAGALVVAREMIALGQEQNDRGIRLAASTALAMNHAFGGRFVEARSVLEVSLADNSADGSEGAVAPLAQDAEVLARSFLSLPLASLGYPEKSATEVGRGIERARRLRHHPSLAVALAIACRQAWLVRDEERAQERAGELVSLCQEQGYPYWLARAQCYAGAIAMINGRPDDGRALLHKGMTTLQESGVVLWNIYSLVADAHARCGYKDAALRLVDKGLAVSSQTTEVWTDAELHRLKGTILLAPPEPDAARAEEELQRALHIARSQSARLLELRGAVSLARLWSAQNRRDAARSLLSPVRAWFTQGPPTLDLREADALLGQLA